GKKIAYSLRKFLPENYVEAITILLDSVDAEVGSLRSTGSMASFMYLPHTHFVATYGLDHFEESMHAQYILTQRFTAEFSIRPFLQTHTEATLKQLAIWTSDQSEHVRR